MEIDNNTSQNNPTQLSQELPQQDDIKQKGYFLPIIGIIILVLVVGVGAYYFGKRSPSSSLSLSSVGPAPSNSSTNFSPNRITNINSGIVAYRLGGTILETGDLWTLDTRDQSKKQITHTENILNVLKWSPDNNYIAVTLQERTSPNHVKWTLATVSTNSGEVVKIPENIEGNFLDWVSATEFLVTKDANVIKISAKGQVIDGDYFVIPDKLQETATGLHFSPDLKWFAYDTAVPEAPPSYVNVYSYSLVNKTKTQLTTQGSADFLAWNADKIIFHSYDSEDSLYMINPDGTDLKKIISFSNKDTIGAELASSSKKLIYPTRGKQPNITDQQKLVTYNLSNGDTKEIYKFDSGIDPADLTISKDQNFVSFMLSGIVNAPSYVIDLNTDKSIKICEASCYYPIWAN